MSHSLDCACTGCKKNPITVPMWELNCWYAQEETYIDANQSAISDLYTKSGSDGIVVLCWKSKQTGYVPRSAGQGRCFMTSVDPKHNFGTAVAVMVMTDLHDPKCTDPWRWHYFTRPAPAPTPAAPAQPIPEKERKEVKSAAP